MEMNESGPDTFDEGYMHQFQPEPTHKIDCPNQHKSSGFIASCLGKRWRFVFDLCIGIKKRFKLWTKMQEGYFSKSFPPVFSLSSNF